MIEILAEKDCNRDTATMMTVGVPSSKRGDELVVEDLIEAAPPNEEGSSDLTISGSVDLSSGMSTARSPHTTQAPFK